MTRDDEPQRPGRDAPGAASSGRGDDAGAGHHDVRGGPGNRRRVLLSAGALAAVALLIYATYIIAVMVRTG